MVLYNLSLDPANHEFLRRQRVSQLLRIAADTHPKVFAFFLIDSSDGANHNPFKTASWTSS